MKNYFSELIPSLCIGVALFLISIPFLTFNFLKNEHFVNFLKSLLPNIVQFIVFGLMYFIVMLIFIAINKGLQKWKTSRAVMTLNNFFNWVLQNLSQPVKGFYQACTGILICCVFIGVTGHLKPVYAFVVCLFALAFSLVPTAIKKFSTISK